MLLPYLASMCSLSKDNRSHECRRGAVALEAQTSGLATSRNVLAAHSSIDQKAVSTPDQGDIGRGQHEDVVPNEVIPDEHSSTPAAGLDTATGFKKENGVGQPPLASATNAEPVSGCADADHVHPYPAFP